MTFKQFSLYLKGHDRSNELTWEQTRFVAFSVFKSTGKMTKLKRPRDLFLLASEKVEHEQKIKNLKPLIERYINNVESKN